VLSAYTKTRHGKVFLKGTLPDPMSDVDLSTLSEKRSAALREVISEMVGHAFTRQGIYLINSLKGVVCQVIKENGTGETSNEGPTLGTYDGEQSLFQYQPKEN
jgi:hypothetical protein